MKWGDPDSPARVEQNYYSTDHHPNHALADFIRDINCFFNVGKNSDKFPLFMGWAEVNSALTDARKEKELIVNYIKNQQDHHKKVNFVNELRRLLIELGIEVDERYFP